MSGVQSYIQGLRDCLAELSPQKVEEIADIMVKAAKRGRCIFIMGNGGSAATASHFVCDLTNRSRGEGKTGVRAISLADNLAVITALANDIDYRSIFQEQLAGQLEEGDVVIGITASGNSPNVLRAMEYAREHGAITVGFIGFGGGELKEMVDKSIILSSRDYGQVEDVHLCLAHMVSYLVRDKVRQLPVRKPRKRGGE